MTWSSMNCSAEETARRIAVCERLNVLCTRRDSEPDELKRKRTQKRIDAILQQERPWLKYAAFFLY